MTGTVFQCDLCPRFFGLQHAYIDHVRAQHTLRVPATPILDPETLRRAIEDAFQSNPVIKFLIIISIILSLNSF